MTEQRKNTVKQTDEHGNVIEVYETEIEQALDQYIAERPDIKSMNEEPQSRWNACLRYIYRNVFKDTDKLKSHEMKYSTSKYIYTNNNEYNTKLVYEVMLKYIDLCFEYGKEVSIIGFSYLTGIEESTFYSWHNKAVSSNNITSTGNKIYQKLTTTREESLSDKLYSSKGNPVGVLGILNHWYGWNMGQPHGNTGTQQQSIEQIQEKYKQLPPENLTPPAENPRTLENTPTEMENPGENTAPPQEKIPPLGNNPPV